uniref:Uncharacterized protein n=1 Tax=Meloidogyne enterolobii TaxID=390850 RepID=A0A6V7U9U1_MELEN|nr:unnamed protein product [Meloidogyne enterolobii]
MNKEYPKLNQKINKKNVRDKTQTFFFFLPSHYFLTTTILFIFTLILLAIY